MNPNEKNEPVFPHAEQNLREIRLLRKSTGSFLTLSIPVETNAKQYVRDNYPGWQLVPSAY